MLRTHYGRYKLQHTSTIDLRRGSRSYVLRNGSMSGKSPKKSPKKNGILRIQKYAIKNGHDLSAAALVSVSQVLNEVVIMVNYDIIITATMLSIPTVIITCRFSWILEIFIF